MDSITLPLAPLLNELLYGRESEWRYITTPALAEALRLSPFCGTAYHIEQDAGSVLLFAPQGHALYLAAGRDLCAAFQKIRAVEMRAELERRLTPLDKNRLKILQELKARGQDDLVEQFCTQWSIPKSLV